MYAPGGAHTRVAFKGAEGHLDVLLCYNVCLFPCEMTIILSHLPSNSPEGPFIFGHQLGDRKGHREPSRSTALPEEYWKVKVWGCQPWLTIEVEIRSKFLELMLLFSYMFK